MAKSLLLLGAGLAIAGGVGAAVSAPKPGAPTDLRVYAKGGLAKLKPSAPRAAPALTFTDAAGRPQTLAASKGKVVIVNLWATWCAPCIKEMPTLAALQRAYGAKGLAVIPATIDRDAALPKARAFIAKNRPLTLRRIPSDAVFKIKPMVEGFPTTLIIDKRGRERARVAGEADWSSPEARALVGRLLAEG
ncbi:MAG: TlpA family protein disulfide reductase [Caulobacteraceae bacterium]